MADAWKSLTALGHDTARTVTVGPYRITERDDVALASVALRRGQDQAFAAAAAKAGVPLPPPLQSASGTPYGAFWVTPDMWFVTAPFASHEDIVAHLKPVFGAAASITEQTDAWVCFDLSGPALTAWMERLCNVDLAVVPDGYATRTMMDHLGVYLLKQGADAVRLFGPRSSAQSLLHALEVAAASLA